MSAKTEQREETIHRQTSSRKSSWKDEEQVVDSEWGLSVQDARPLLPKASFFLGDLRDGLPMVGKDARGMEMNCETNE